MNALPRRPAARIALIWGLIVALVVYGYSGALLQLLGPMHRHAEVPQAAESSVLVQQVAALSTAVSQWHDRVVSQALFVHERERFLPSPRADGPNRAQAQAQVHTHHHGLFERHHHGHDDPSVLSLDAGSAAESLASSMSTLGSATLPLCISPVLNLPDPGACASHWSGPPAPSWRNAERKLLERPPQA